MSDEIEISKYASYDVPNLRKLLKSIDKYDEPEFFDEIKTLIACKEFGVCAERAGNPNHVKDTSGKKLPGSGNSGYRSGAGFYTK